MASWLRWALVVPAAVAAWYVALFVGLAAYSGMNSLCPSAQVISGMCVAPWFPVASAVLRCAAAGLSAALVLLACAWVAPSHKTAAATVVFTIGVVAALVTGGAYAIPETTSAIATGLGVAAYIYWGRGDVQAA